MSWFLIIMQVLPSIVKLVSLVEEAFSSFKGSGSVKKQVVMDSLEAVTTGMQAVSTGGQQATWSEIKQVAPALIDGVVALANSASRVTGGKDVVTETTTVTEVTTNTMGRVEAGGQ